MGNIAVGVGVGAGIGMAIGFMLQRKEDEQDSGNSEN
jgi:hypothetical protein